MTSASGILLLGLLLGLKHATEADHLAAVATLATRQATLGQAVRQGIAWGIGHTVTLMAFGGAVIALGRAIAPETEAALETAVGVMLVLLGLDVLRRLATQRIHFHRHVHGTEPPHLHAHSHAGEGAHARSRHEHGHAPRHWPLRALVVGMVHGLAGSAALVVLSLQSVASIPLAIAYVALFGLGSIAGMALLSAAVALPLRLSARYVSGLHAALSAAVGAATVALGVVTIVEIGWLAARLAA